MTVIASRVTDARKPVTSHTGVTRNMKARETLQTAQAILRAGGDHYAADLLDAQIRLLNHAIRDYYAAMPAAR